MARAKEFDVSPVTTADKSNAMVTQTTQSSSAEVDYNDTTKTSLQCESIRNMLTRPQDMLGINSNRLVQKDLRSGIQYLFGYLEHLASIPDQKKKGVNVDAAPLSGLIELFTGDNDDVKDDDHEDGMVDAETIWGQVDLQNEALLPILKKTTKELGKSVKRYGKEKDKYHLIRLVDLDDMSSEDEDVAGDAEGDKVSMTDGDDDNDSANEEEDEDEKSLDGEDEEAKRIRERMERSMAAMEEEDSEEDDEEESKQIEGDNVVADDDSESNSPSSVDPAAEDLNDGFFDLHDMEAFADEEEDYHMPADDDNEGEGGEDKIRNRMKEAKKLKKKKRRVAYDDSDSEEEDGNDDYDEDNEVMAFKRKKYRADDEIDALMGIYETTGYGDSDDDSYADENDNPINMTAAAFFGKPNQKYSQKPVKQNSDRTQSAKMSKASKHVAFKDNGDDADSWDQEKFDDENKAEWPDRDREMEDEAPEDMAENEDEENELAEEDEAENPASSFGKQSKRLHAQTKQLEQEILAEKPWQMKGEAVGTSRPVNSLLEATPQFEVTAKMAPVITEEHTESIEEIIKRRVLDEDWDDVVPRELPNVGKKSGLDEAPEVSQERSKLGLGELYEREYLKKVKGYDVDAAETSSKEKKLEDEIKSMYANLCSKLDAMSNYNFAPRPVEEEAEVHNVTTPAIAMEEVLPLHVSDARAVAPEEVYGSKKGRESVLKGENEIDQAERKSLRAAKKAGRRKERKAKLADERLVSRLTPGLGLNNPYEKRKLREDLSRARATGKIIEGAKDGKSDYATSTTFFQSLQDDVQKTVRGEGDNSSSKKRRRLGESDRENQKSSAYKL
jgi:U3 small nucleolar RNA-associated protein MPP10